jgi:hypothetical protein
MSTIKTFVAKHPAPVYFALTVAISWGGALMAIGASDGMRGTTPTSDPRFVYALLVSRPRNSWRNCRSGAPRWQGATSENIGHI